MIQGSVTISSKRGGEPARGHLSWHGSAPPAMVAAWMDKLGVSRARGRGRSWPDRTEEGVGNPCRPISTPSDRRHHLRPWRWAITACSHACGPTSDVGSSRRPPVALGAHVAGGLLRRIMVFQPLGGSPAAVRRLLSAGVCAGLSVVTFTATVSRRRLVNGGTILRSSVGPHPVRSPVAANYTSRPHLSEDLTYACSAPNYRDAFLLKSSPSRCDPSAGASLVWGSVASRQRHNKPSAKREDRRRAA